MSDAVRVFCDVLIAVSLLILAVAALVLVEKIP